jgi:hypothetical protein
MVLRREGGVRRRFWRAAIARQRASGLSVRAFCRRENLSEPSFYAWRKRLATDRGGSRTTAFAAVRVVDDSKQPNVLSGDDRGPCEHCVEIVLVDGVRVRVPPGVDRRMLADVLIVLREWTATSDHGAGGGQEAPAC